MEATTEEDVKDLQYHPLDGSEEWRILTVREVLEMKAGERELPEGWTWREPEDLLEVACIS